MSSCKLIDSYEQLIGLFRKLKRSYDRFTKSWAYNISKFIPYNLELFSYIMQGIKIWCFCDEMNCMSVLYKTALSNIYRHAIQYAELLVCCYFPNIRCYEYNTILHNGLCNILCILTSSAPLHLMVQTQNEEFSWAREIERQGEKKESRREQLEIHSSWYKHGCCPKIEGFAGTILLHFI